MKYLLFCGVLLFSLNSIAQSKKKQIEMLEHRVDSLKEANLELQEYNLTEISELKEEVQVLTKIIKGYVALIDELSMKNLELEEENVDLKEVVSDMKDLDSEEVVTLRNSSTTSSPFEDVETVHESRNIEFANSSTGISYGKGRKRLNQVQVNNIQIDEEATIYYKLTVDSNGNVVAFSNLKSKTTTRNMTLINKLGVAIKKQVKYNKVSETQLTYELYSIFVRAN